MPETHTEQIARVEMMAEASGGPSDTWDLSDNDCAALKAVLEDRAELLRTVKAVKDFIVAPFDTKALVNKGVAEVIAKVEGKP